MTKFTTINSGFPGGIRARKLGEILAKKPEELLMLAVKRMLPKNKIRKTTTNKT